VDRVKGAGRGDVKRKDNPYSEHHGSAERRGNVSTTPAGRRSLLRRKPVGALVHETGADREGGELERSIGLFQLTMFGVGATIGTGIFIVLSEAVPEAGPAVVLSFVLAGITAALTAVCYAELASTIPVSGSSYSYTYATMGEIVAFGVAACLLLEYGVSSAAVAVGWGEYLNSFFTSVFGFRLPDAISLPPGEGGVFNVPAVVLVTLCGLLLARGARESARANTIMVLIKLAVLALFIVVGFSAFSGENLQPFAPFGVAGISLAASSIFFSFIGLDAVSTAGEEVRNPQRTLPRAIIFATITVTVFYVLVALAAVGAQPTERFEGQEAGLAAILLDITGSSVWPAILAAGAVISIFSVTLVTIYGQTRILFAISRDGLLPSIFRRVDPRTLVPVNNTVIVCVFVGLMAGLVPLGILIDLTSMGTLVAFTVVSIGVIILRRTQPDLPRGFRVPGYPVTPVLSAAFALYLISGLPLTTFGLFAVWLGVAAIVYFTYSVRHSLLARGIADTSEEPRQ
jgi:APA family basic amino acid/polyamine antiporter